MVTPEEEQKLLEQLGTDIDAEVAAAFGKVAADIRKGVSPRDAVADAMARFEGPLAETYQQKLSAALERSVGDGRALLAQAPVTLSEKLYDESQKLGTTVAGIVDRNRRGYQSARTLALDLYEGYGFKPEEPLTINRKNRDLPKYLRDVLAAPGVQREMSSAFAKAQAKALRTGALQAAYNGLLKAIDDVQDGVGAKALDRAIGTAVEERARYFSKRIAQTELHRQYAMETAVEMMDDPDIEWVEVRLSGRHKVKDICDLIAGADRYGMGPGVYPKAEVPVPAYHPFCRCNLVARTDLTGRGGDAKYKDGAELSFLRRIPVAQQARIVGSYAKLEQLQAGGAGVAILNASNATPTYRVRRAVDVKRQNG